jgi:hypothetical protein
MCAVDQHYRQQLLQMRQCQRHSPLHRVSSEMGFGRCSKHRSLTVPGCLQGRSSHHHAHASENFVRNSTLSASLAIPSCPLQQVFERHCVQDRLRNIPRPKFLNRHSIVPCYTPAMHAEHQENIRTGDSYSIATRINEDDTSWCCSSLRTSRDLGTHRAELDGRRMAVSY